MSTSKSKSAYSNLMRRCQTGRDRAEKAQNKLETLLEQAAARKPAGESKDAEKTLAELVRGRLESEWRPVLDELDAKYREQGVTLRMDAADFLNGGRKLTIEISYHNHALRLEGTVTHGGIAFYEMRTVNGVETAWENGPMLNGRQITSDDFREFLCDHIGSLVRFVLRRR